MPKKTLITLAFLPLALVTVPMAAGASVPSSQAEKSSVSVVERELAQSDATPAAVVLWGTVGGAGLVSMLGYGVMVTRKAAGTPRTARRASVPGPATA